MKIEAILDQCLEDIQLGRCTIAECLARYPEHAKELEPLLQAAVALNQAPDAQPSPQFKQALRERILNFSKPEETEPIKDLLTRSDAEQKSTSNKPDGPAEEQESHSPVCLVPPTKQDA